MPTEGARLEAVKVSLCRRAMTRERTFAPHLSIVVLQGGSQRIELHKAESVIAEQRAINGLPEIKRVLQLDQSKIVWALEDFVKRVAISRAKREE